VYRRILVTLDGSETAERILPHVTELARCTNAELTLLRVVEPVDAAEAITEAGFVSSHALLLRELEAREYLVRIRARTSRAGVHPQLEVRSGAPTARVIVAGACELGADLIAMGTHGRSGLRRMVLGSVAEAVVRTATTPVLLLRTAEVRDASRGAAPG